MEIYDKVIKIVDVNLIYCLIPMILTLILIELLFKKRFPTKKVLSLISWIIISYSVVTLIHLTIGIMFYPNEFGYIDRITGPYKIAHSMMFLSATILPFTLLIKKFASRFWYVLLVAFFLKIGAYYEHFVIVTTGFYRDDAPESWSSESFNLWTYGLLVATLQGLLLVVLILGILIITERKKTVTPHDAIIHDPH